MGEQLSSSEVLDGERRERFKSEVKKFIQNGGLEKNEEFCFDGQKIDLAGMLKPLKKQKEGKDFNDFESAAGEAFWEILSVTKPTEER